MVKKIILGGLCFLSGCLSCPVFVTGCAVGLCVPNSRNAVAIATDWLKFLFCRNDVSRQDMFDFCPSEFDVTCTNVVYKIRFEPRFPQPHEIVIRYLYDDKSAYGEKHIRHHPLNAHITIRHQGEVYRQLEVAEALVVARISAESLEWRVCNFDPGLFPWWYKEEIEVEVIFQKFDDVRYERTHTGSLFLRSVIPLL